ncbi:MAG: branched-chain amino acid ABC transporter permease [Candidatus Atabeyarchaeum deiterrae]
MPKKIRRSVSNAASATKNFGKWVPSATRHFFKEIPPTSRRFRLWVKTFPGVLTLLCLLGVIFFPLATSSEYYLGLFIYANIFAIFAASWDLLAGFAGQVSFGHAAFLGMSGYVTSAVVQYFDQSWQVALIAGALVTVVLALLVGVPSLRLHGPYFALGTLALALILNTLFRMGSLGPWLGGSGGVSGVRPLSPDPIIEYFVNLAFMVGCVVVMIVIVNSRVGTIFRAIRDDETSAEAAGINVTKYKLVALMISAFFAGIAGSLFALHFRGADPERFSTIMSFYPIVIVALGGLGTIFGSIGGAYFFVFLGEFLRDAAALSMLIFAAVLIFVIRFASSGFTKPLVKYMKEWLDMLRGK